MEAETQRRLSGQPRKAHSRADGSRYALDAAPASGWRERREVTQAAPGHDPKPERRDERVSWEEHREALLDEALEQSFPASDPFSIPPSPPDGAEGAALGSRNAIDGVSSEA